MKNKSIAETPDNEQPDNLIQSGFAGNPTRQTPEEYNKDKHSTTRDTIDVSRSAERVSDADTYAGSDRTGTAERKSQELNTDEHNEGQFGS